jgi:hypothetical protein
MLSYNEQGIDRRPATSPVGDPTRVTLMVMKHVTSEHFARAARR